MNNKTAPQNGRLSASPNSSAQARRTPDPRDTANYIADMVLEMRNMAKAAGLTTLLGLLEVTFYEAFSVANRVEIPEAELNRLRNLAKLADQ